MGIKHNCGYFIGWNPSERTESINETHNKIMSTDLETEMFINFLIYKLY
jgi:hypothetical protein